MKPDEKEPTELTPFVSFDRSLAVTLLQMEKVEAFNQMINDVRTHFRMDFVFDLKGVVLEGLKLMGVDFQGADLTGARFNKSNLDNALLNGANLSKAQFNSSSLNGTDLSCGILQGTSFKKASMRQANLDKSFVDRVNFYKADLRGAIQSYIPSEQPFALDLYVN